MRSAQTLFIIGAGASKEAGLPTGKELIEIIAGRLDYRIEHGSLRQGTGDCDILEIFQQNTETRDGITAYLEAAWRIREGIVFSKSIDSFMDLHRDDERIQLCGKLAIVKSILEAEQNSKLYIDKKTRRFRDVNGMKDTWLVNFAKNLNDGIRKPDREKIFDKATFVIFNYDRCFEHFMLHALQDLYGIDEKAASDVMRRVQIIHPYGTIGDLPWQDSDGIPFGFKANRANMEFMAKRIRTYTEQIAHSDTLGALKKAVSGADTLVFLGFSYHPENMKLLTLDGPGETQQVFGTAKDISVSDIAIIQDQVREMIANKALKAQDPRGLEGERLFIKDLTCADLLQEFSRSLFAAGRSEH